MSGIDALYDKVVVKNPGEKEFHQAVQEVVESILPYINKHPKYQKAKIQIKNQILKVQAGLIGLAFFLSGKVVKKSCRVCKWEYRM